MITNIENTLFHLIGNSGILMDKLPVIAKNFFLDIVDNRYNPSKNILLMKYLLQSMGWGKLTFIETGNSVTLQIKNPPYGLQSDRDNWDFLAGTFLGFLLALDKNYSIDNINYSYKQIRIKYST